MRAVAGTDRLRLGIKVATLTIAVCVSRVVARPGSMLRRMT